MQSQRETTMQWTHYFAGYTGEALFTGFAGRSDAARRSTLTSSTRPTVRTLQQGAGLSLMLELPFA